MCRSMADIHSAMAKIRREKKEKNKLQDKNIMSASAMQGGHKQSRLNQKNTQNAKSKQTPKLSKLFVNLNQHSSLRTAHVCLYHCVQLLYTTQHRTVLIIFPLILQTIIIA